MSEKSLIRKYQLHPDINDLVSGYGSNVFITLNQLSGILSSGDTSFTVISSPTVLTAGQKYAVNTATGSFDIYLPENPAIGSNIRILDFSETFDTNNLIIHPETATIENISNQNLLCNVKGAVFDLIYTGPTRGWQIVTQFATAGPVQLNANPGTPGGIGATGPVGPTGATGATGNSVLNGIVDPTPQANIGREGDFYINTSTYKLFGPRLNNGWNPTQAVNLIGPAGPPSNVIPLLFLNIQRGNNSQLFDSNDVSNYKIMWNNVEWYNTGLVALGSTPDVSKTITYNTGNKNIYFNQTGIYNVDLRYSSYNLTDATDFLRARLRSWTGAISDGQSQNNPLLDVGLDVNGNELPYSSSRPFVLAAFAQGPIGTTFNGEATCAGFTTFRITGQLYVCADFLHVGALRVLPGQPNQTWGYPVYTGPYGNIPFMFISKVV